MRYLLDTNVCIKILKGKSQGILNKITKIDKSGIVIPSVVQFELYYGAYKSVNKEAKLKILKEFLSSFQIINFDSKSAEICGKIRAELEQKGTPIGPYDLIIAATALSKKLVLVTNNTKEFSRVENLLLENWE